MELKSLVLGLAFTLGIFAVKSGAGLAYLLATSGYRERIRMLAVYSTGYLLFFTAIGIGTHALNITDKPELFLEFFSAGMLVHFTLAIGMVAWGTLLLTRFEHGRTHSWLLLVVPCPVCCGVLFCSSLLFTIIFPEVKALLPLLFLGYMATALLTAAFLVTIPASSSPEKQLGWLMLAIALYFLLTIFIVPHFQEVERIYRISEGRTVFPATGINLQFFCLLTLLFTTGFLINKRAPK